MTTVHLAAGVALGLAAYGEMAYHHVSSTGPLSRLHGAEEPGPAAELPRRGDVRHPGALHQVTSADISLHLLTSPDI